MASTGNKFIWNNDSFSASTLQGYGGADSMKEHVLSSPDDSNSMSGLQVMSVEYAQYHGYVAALVCVFGIIANLANIVVLTRNNMITSTNIILTWLAVADLMTMMSYFPVSIHFYIMADWRLPFPSSLHKHWMQFMLFHINFCVVAHTIAIWLTIALAIFRYLFISHPTRGVELCSIHRAKVCVIAVYLLTCVICIPNYLGTNIMQSMIHVPSEHFLPQSPNETNISHTQTTNISFYEFGVTEISDPFLEIFNFWIQAILIKVTSICVMT